MSTNDGWGKGWGQPVADKAVEYLNKDKPTDYPILDTRKPDFFSNTEVNPFAPIEMTLTIRVDGEPKLIKGTRIGDLIVHEHVGKWGCWQVSHVPTLVHFMKAVPDGNWSREQLINWCVKVQQGLPKDWERLASLTINSYLEVDKETQKAKDRVQQFCLMTPVTSTDNDNV